MEDKVTMQLQINQGRGREGGGKGGGEEERNVDL